MVLYDQPPPHGTTPTVLAVDDTTAFMALRFMTTEGPPVVEGGHGAFFTAVVDNPPMTRHAGSAAFINVWGDAKRGKDGRWHRSQGCWYAEPIPSREDHCQEYGGPKDEEEDVLFSPSSS